MPEGPVSATRIAWLELADERRLVREGYALLDEKRVLLAARILQGLRLYAVLRARWLEALAAARAAVGAAAARHGFEGLAAQPPGQVPAEALEVGRHRLLGLTLPEARLAPAEPRPAWPAIEPSAEAGAAALACRALLEQAAPLAALECSLRRLAREYQRTERRARALENVLLPELDAALRQIEAQLEGVEQEEAVRVRHARGAA